MLIFLAMVANSLQSSALSLRLATQGVPSSRLGLVMSCAFVGLLIGSQVAGAIIARAGARMSIAFAAVFLAAAFAGLTTSSQWQVAALIRLCIGLGLAVVYVVVESELNAKATTRTRATFMSTYMTVVFLGMMLGQPLLVITDPMSGTSFSLAAAITMLMIGFIFGVPNQQRGTVQVALDRPGRLPVAVVAPAIGCFCMGMSQGAFFGVGPAFAHTIGMSNSVAALFMLCGVLGGGALQLPIGRAADAWGRRGVILISVCVATLALVAAIAATGTDQNHVITIVIIALWGGAIMPIYPILLAVANDHLEYDQMVVVSGRLIAAFGLGAVLGPVGTAGAMDCFGPKGFYAILTAGNIVLAVSIMARMAPTREGVL